MRQRGSTSASKTDTLLDLFAIFDAARTLSGRGNCGLKQIAILVELRTRARIVAFERIDEELRQERHVLHHARHVPLHHAALEPDPVLGIPVEARVNSIRSFDGLYLPAQ